MARKEVEIVEERKRWQKGEVKRIEKVAKEQGRANRDEDMDFFAAYYKSSHFGAKFKDFKKMQTHPQIIKTILNDDSKCSKA